MLQRQSFTRDRWRHYVKEQLDAADVEIERLQSGAYRIIRGTVHLTVEDLSYLRDVDLEDLTK